MISNPNVILMKNQWIFSLACIFCISMVVLAFTNKNEHNTRITKINTIVVDAGHGFKGSLTARDGTVGSEITEDEVSYEVSKKLVEELKKEMPDVKIIESRPTPYFVGIRERANFANNNKGNLFVSLHCNSAPKLREVRREGTKTETYYVYTGKGKKKKKIKKTRQVGIYKTYYHPNPAQGTETFVFGVDKTDEKEDILMENGEVYENEKDDSTFTPNINDPITKQRVALWTKQFFSNSVKLATIVEEEFIALGRFSRGVKQRQKGIWVLQATAMPSILIELGFLSNKSEEDFLMSTEGQQQMATAIAKAIKRYKELVEKTPITQTNQGNKK
jgi:N-acetylmuramoyl-L-alanine amidase